MDDLARQILAGEEAWIVGGAVRDRLLGRPVIDLDIACADPRSAARDFVRRAGGAVFPLSERHGAWRVALSDGRTVDFTPLRATIEADLAGRDFTINAIAEPLAGGDVLDPFSGRRDLRERNLRAVSEGVFADDPLRLLRAVRIEDELDFRLDGPTASSVRAHAHLVDAPAGERVLGELTRLSERGFRRLSELGLLAPLGGSLERLEHVDRFDGRDFLLVVIFGEALERLPIPTRLQRYGRTLRSARPPADASPRAIHRFRRATEPWAFDALAYLGAGELAGEVRAARGRDPREPLLRGDELGLPPGPEIGRLLELVAEERAAGTVATRAEALELVRREFRPGGVSVP